MIATRWPVALCLIGAFGATAPVLAADNSPNVEITPFVGYRLGGEFDFVDPADPAGAEQSVDLSDDASFGIDFGVYRDNTSFYELIYSRQETDLDTNEPSLQGVDMKVEYLHFGGTLLFPEDRIFVPYLSLTIGATRLDAQSGGHDSETKFSASLGGGFRFPISDQFAITTGLRGWLTFVDSDTDIFCVGSGDLNCLLRTSGSTFFQGEATLGFTVVF